MITIIMNPNHFDVMTAFGFEVKAKGTLSMMSIGTDINRFDSSIEMVQ